MKGKIVRKVKIDGIEYALTNDVWKDEYGYQQSQARVYKREGKKKWELFTPEYYNLSIWDAERYMPHEVKTCPTCGHKTVHKIN